MQEMERSADVLAAGLLEVSDPSLSSKFFLRQVGFSISLPRIYSAKHTYVACFSIYPLHMHTPFTPCLIVLNPFFFSSIGWMRVMVQVIPY